MEKTSRDVLRSWGFEEGVLEMWSDDDCDENLEAIQMYPEG